MLTGGGSGGHITPVLAVAHKLKESPHKIDIIYAIGRKDRLAYLPEDDSTVTKVFYIWSGKFRRYYGEGISQLLDISTLLKNIRDFFFVIVGIIQSIYVLHSEKPNIIFIKGGFVGVPVGIAAALLKIPYITHDSDAIPGLANRIISRWASHHAVAMPVKNYSYDEAKTTQVGVPIDSNFNVVTKEQQAEFLHAIGLKKDSEVLLITGGGLGAARLNNAVISIANTLLSQHQKLHLIHITGPQHDGVVQVAYNQKIKNIQCRERIHVKPFVKDMYRYTGAATIIVARAGASSLAEFAAQQKACIIVANPQLTGGHQIKNATYLESEGAIASLSDIAIQVNPDLLRKEVDTLLGDEELREKLAKNLHTTADYNAAQKLADILIKEAKRAE